MSIQSARELFTPYSERPKIKGFSRSFSASTQSQRFGSFTSSKSTSSSSSSRSKTSSRSYKSAHSNRERTPSHQSRAYSNHEETPLYHSQRNEYTSGSSYPEESYQDYDVALILEKLHQNRHLKIRGLSGDIQEVFDDFVNYVRLMQDRDDYGSFYEEVCRHFSADEVYTPGTIGSFCGGCLLPSADKRYVKGCNAVCAGSIPPPYDEDNWEYCPFLVMWVTYSGDKYDFTMLNNIEGRADNQAIIYLESDSINNFPGFSEDEKRALQEQGINEVHLKHFNNESRQDVSLTNGFVSLDQVKTRTPTSRVVSGSNFNWGMLVLLFIIIIVAFFFLCWLRRS